MSQDNDLETTLRALYAEVPAPAPPASWLPAPAVTRQGLTRRHGRSWLAGRSVLALVAGAAVVTAGLVTHHGAAPAGPGSPTSPTSPGTAGLQVTLTPAGARLGCQLPISALSNDHTSGFVLLGGRTATFQPVTTDGTTYVRALDRWVDTSPALVAPDGRSYVTNDNSAADHHLVVTVTDASGTRTVFTGPSGEHAQAYTTQGILVDSLDGAVIHRRVIDPHTGAVRALAADVALPVVAGSGGGGAVAGYIANGNATWIASHDNATDVSTVVREDMATGTLTTWYTGTTDGLGSVSVVGADLAGRPLVQVSRGGDLSHTDPSHSSGIQVRTLLLTAPHTARVLNQGVVGAPGVTADLSPLSVTDGDKVWLATDDGAIWVYLADGTFEQVAKVSAGLGGGSPGVVISGPCR